MWKPGVIGASYSGGTGGGSGLITQYLGLSSNTSVNYGFNGLNNGYRGGNSWSPEPNTFWVYGGVGNPGGTSYGNANAKGNNGTGGLLMVFANSINNNGKITANGVGNGRTNAGGSSGGGSINIFYKNTFTNANENNITAAGGISVNNSKYGKAGNGGNGSVTIGSIETGSFVSK